MELLCILYNCRSSTIFSLRLFIILLLPTMTRIQITGKNLRHATVLSQVTQKNAQHVNPKTGSVMGLVCHLQYRWKVIHYIPYPLILYNTFRILLQNHHSLILFFAITTFSTSVFCNSQHQVLRPRFTLHYICFTPHHTTERS